jgi:uncharacterized repeat protein (TIGR01451 family)
MIIPSRLSLVAILLFVSSVVLLPSIKAQQADMGVSKTGPGQAAAGANVSYTIEVFNAGPDDAVNATVTDPLPAGLMGQANEPPMTFVSIAAPAGWSCTTPAVGSNGTVSCSDPTFVAGSDVFFTLIVQIPPATPPGTTFTNIATVSSQTGDPNSENDSSAAATTVPEPSADMGVSKAADSSQALANSNVTYTIQVNNGGPNDAANAELDDTLPGDMTFVSLQQTSGPTWTCNSLAPGSGGTVVCTIATLPVGSTSTFILIGHIPSGESSGTTYLNTASVTTSSNDPNPENNSADASTSVVAAAPTLTTHATGSVSLGGAISDVATLSGGSGATGTIDFFAYGPNDSSCSGPVVSTSSVSVIGDAQYGSGSFVPSAPGIYRFTASYSGDGNNKATATVCNAPNESVTVTQGTTSTTITTSKSPTVFGENVTFTAKVTPNAPATATPTGSVQFLVDNAALGNPVALNNGMAQLTTNSIGAGSHTIKASYQGDNNYTGSNNTTSQVVNQDATTTSVTSSANPSTAGQSVTFTATVAANSPGSGTPTGTVQFVIDGANAGGSVALSSGMAQFTTSSLTVAGSPHSVSATYSGDSNFLGSSGSLAGGQTVNPAPTPTPTPTPTATPTPTPTATPAQSLNISTRLRVQTGDNVGIGGFIIRGNASKAVVLRGLGPSLVNSGLPAASVLNDPFLELHGPNGALIAFNDNWKESPQAAQIQGTIFQPKDDHESVILATLPPASYTVILKGVGQTSGIGTIEVYDNNQAVDSDLANISTRGFVQTGDNVMIGGFTLGGNNNPTRIAVRALGPSLTNSGLSNVLADPTLELHNANGTIMVSNDDWQSDPASAAQLTANGLALPNPKESGIFTSLAPPGQFTAIVAGKTGGIGIGLVEIYNLR